VIVECDFFADLSEKVPERNFLLIELKLRLDEPRMLGNVIAYDVSGLFATRPCRGRDWRPVRRLGFRGASSDRRATQYADHHPTIVAGPNGAVRRQRVAAPGAACQGVYETPFDGNVCSLVNEMANRLRPLVSMT
jgi:hypothetical protein